MVATTTEQLTALSGTTVVVHPLVLLSVADHHARTLRGASNKRVIGVLLGQDNGKTVNVANSFGIPFEEDERDPKTWFLDHNYIEGMWEMFKKVNAREKMIGWYHTGPKLRASDQEINDLLKRYIARPVMVIVDVRPQTVGIPTDAYFAVEEIKDDGTETRKTFLHVPSAIEAEEAEEIGVEHLLRDIKDSTTTTLSTRVSEQLASLRGLQSRLSDIQKYLVDVAAGKMPVNHQIAYYLQDALNLLPDLSNQETTQSFASTTNDELLVVYLSSLLRAVIALHALVDNKASIGRAEMEEEGKGKESKDKVKDKEKSKDKDGKDAKGEEKKDEKGKEKVFALNYQCLRRKLAVEAGPTCDARDFVGEAIVHRDVAFARTSASTATARVEAAKSDNGQRIQRCITLIREQSRIIVVGRADIERAR